MYFQLCPSTIDKQLSKLLCSLHKPRLAAPVHICDCWCFGQQLHSDRLFASVSLHSRFEAFFVAAVRQLKGPAFASSLELAATTETDHACRGPSLFRLLVLLYCMYTRC